MITALSLIALGFFLGMRHATDADHIIAVSTIVTRQGTLRGGVLIGGLWGLGHTLTIVIVGGAIVVFSVVIPPAANEAAAPSQVFLGLMRGAMRCRPIDLPTNIAAALRYPLSGDLISTTSR